YSDSNAQNEDPAFPYRSDQTGPPDRDASPPGWRNDCRVGQGHPLAGADPAGLATALRDRIFAATHRLADLEAFELRMVEVERLVLAGVPMGKMLPTWSRLRTSPCS